MNKKSFTKIVSAGRLIYVWLELSSFIILTLSTEGAVDIGYVIRNKLVENLFIGLCLNSACIDNNKNVACWTGIKYKQRITCYNRR